MARIARLVVPHYPHHVTQRGNRRQQTFFCQPDYQLYLDLVAEFCEEKGTEIWAYCLMPNHVHLVMVPATEDGLRATLSEAHRRYTRHINFRQGWRGHLWQERFHSFLMDEQYLLATVRYVERNPVSAKLCKRPEDWNWSSASASAHLKAKDDALVRVKPMLDRVQDWAAYLSQTDKPADEDSIKANSQTGRPLGNAEFIQHLELLTGRELVPKKSGRKPSPIK
jgi:putative transposase